MVVCKFCNAKNAWRMLLEAGKADQMKNAAKNMRIARGIKIFSRFWRSTVTIQNQACLCAGFVFAYPDVSGDCVFQRQFDFVG